MGVIATRINNESDKSFRQLCKQRELTVSQGLNELVNKTVNDGLNRELPEDIPEVNTVLKNVDTTEEKLEKVQELKLEITKLAMKRGSGESRHFSDLFFYDEVLQGLITGLRSELDTLLEEIETDRQSSQGEVKREV